MSEGKFEELFKSELEAEEICETCGHTMEKGMKSKGKKASAKGMAKQIGNEADPHKGGKTGSFVTGRPRPGSLGEVVNRKGAAGKPKSGIVGKSETESTFAKAMFPVTSNVQLVSYTDGSHPEAAAKTEE